MRRSPLNGKPFGGRVGLEAPARASVMSERK
jgi:hypothetical protein